MFTIMLRSRDCAGKSMVLALFPVFQLLEVYKKRRGVALSSCKVSSTPSQVMNPQNIQYTFECCVTITLGLITCGVTSFGNIIP